METGYETEWSDRKRNKENREQTKQSLVEGSDQSDEVQLVDDSVPRLLIDW